MPTRCTGLWWVIAARTVPHGSSGVTGESDPILNLVITHNEVPHLLRKLGPERFVTSQERDKIFAAEAVSRWRKSTGVTVKPGDLLSLLTITLALVAQRGQMPADHYRNAVALLRDVFVHRFAGASK